MKQIKVGESVTGIEKLDRGIYQILNDPDKFRVLIVFDKITPIVNLGTYYGCVLYIETFASFNNVSYYDPLGGWAVESFRKIKEI